MPTIWMGWRSTSARCVAAGVAGLSIEDATAVVPDAPPYPLAEAGGAGPRRAVRDRRSGADVLLTARAECFLLGHPEPLREAIRRLQAFAEAGAEVVYAPGVRTREDIASLVDALNPYPLNVLMASDTGLTVNDLAELGVRRISVGSALSRVAWGAFLFGRVPACRGRLVRGFGPGLASFGELNGLFG